MAKKTIVLPPKSAATVAVKVTTKPRKKPAPKLTIPVFEVIFRNTGGAPVLMGRRHAESLVSAIADLNYLLHNTDPKLAATITSVEAKLVVP